MPKVLALLSGNIKALGGCEIYRVSLPLHFLSKDPNWEVSWLPASQVTILELQRMAASHDIFVLPRYFAPVSQVMDGVKAFVRLVHRNGGKVIYETDDDYTNKHRKVHGGGETAMAIAGMCDAITVTTPHLRKVMKSIDKPTHVLPNHVDCEAWASAADIPRKVEGLVIGLTGSTTHHYDWMVLKDVLPSIMEDYENVTLFLMGFHPPYFDALHERVIREPGRPYQNYMFTIRGIDVVLAPVVPSDEFNKSKSAIKVIEGMASARPVGKKLGGAACLATDMPVYRRVINHRNNGLLVEHTPEAWDKALRTIIEDHNLRSRLQLNGLKWARRNRDMASGYRLWRDVYTEILQTRRTKKKRRSQS